MKSRIILVGLVLFSISIALNAQSPGKLNYQGVARNASGEPYVSQDIGLRFTIISSSMVDVYTETQSFTTNEFGLITTSIGEGNPTTFNAIDWGGDSYSLKVELDLGNNGSWEIEETKALSSVPFALYGEDADADPTNELQTLSISGNQLSISDGNTIDLPTGTASPWLTSGSSLYYNSGKIGIGTDSPTARLDVTGGITLSGQFPPDIWAQSIVALGPIGGYFGTQGSYKSYWTWNGYRKEGTTDWVVGGAHTYTSSTLIALGDNGIEMATRDYGATGTYSSWPALRFKITKEGNVGIGTNVPTSLLHVQGNPEFTDEEPLFEVKNSDGVPVFAVYNNGVRILVNDDPSDLKARTRGGFAVAGFDSDDKGYQETYNLVKITPDSIRFNIDNSAIGKAPGTRGGFAVGGFDRDDKATINEDFMFITPVGSNAGQYNTKLGYRSGNGLEGGINNVLLGYQSGYNMNSGDRNVLIGDFTGYSAYTGNNNVAIGYEAGMNIGTGSDNIYIGQTAGKDLSNGSGNIIIGKYPAGFIGTGSSNHLVISNGSNVTPMIFGNFETRQMGIDAELFLYQTYNNIISGTPRDVQILANGELGTMGSSKRYKENITAMGDINWIYELNPVSFSYISDKSAGLNYGLIAEEVEEIDPYFVTYNKDGQVDAITYSKFITPLIKAVQEQEKEIDYLKGQILELQTLMQVVLEKQE